MPKFLNDSGLSHLIDKIKALFKRTHQEIGINLWDEEWRVGMYDLDNGKFISNSIQRVASTHFIPIIPSEKYWATYTVVGINLYFYDKNKAFISAMTNLSPTQFPITAPSNACYMTFDLHSSYGTTYKNDTCINASDGDINGTYYPYRGLRKQITEVSNEALDIKMLGWSVPKECPIHNYMDSERKFHQRVNRKKLKDLTWTLSGTNTFHTQTIANCTKFYTVKYVAVDDERIVGNTSAVTYLDNMHMTYRHGTNDRIYLKNTSCDDVTALLATFGDNDYIYYELATEIVTNVDGEEFDFTMKSVNPVSSGSFSHGRKANTTIGTNSIAIGNNLEVSGNNSFATGLGNTVTDDYSMVGGYNNIVSSESNMVGGYNNIVNANANYNFVSGANNEVSHSYCEVAGRNLKSCVPYGAVFGRYNLVESNKVLIVGGGDSDSNRKNIFTVDASGRIGVTHAIELYGHPSGTSTSRIALIPNVPYSLIDPTATTETYLKELLKWICANYPGRTNYIFTGLEHPNSYGTLIVQIYDTSDVDTNGYPKYAGGVYQSASNPGYMVSFGFSSYNWSFSSIIPQRNTLSGITSSYGTISGAVINVSGKLVTIHFTLKVTTAFTATAGVIAGIRPLPVYNTPIQIANVTRPTAVTYNSTMINTGGSVNIYGSAQTNVNDELHFQVNYFIS